MALACSLGDIAYLRSVAKMDVIAHERLVVKAVGSVLSKSW